MLHLSGYKWSYIASYLLPTYKSNARAKIKGHTTSVACFIPATILLHKLCIKVAYKLELKHRPDLLVAKLCWTIYNLGDIHV